MDKPKKPIGEPVWVRPDALALARGVCVADPNWTLKAFVSAAIFEKVKRMKLNPSPVSAHKVRRGRPPPKVKR